MGAKTVQGITVTINGNATGLGKVLKEAKAASMGLNKELKEVNKALKFNPSSTSMLAEKQKVLQEAVAAAKDEVKQLEAAQEDVERQYAAGDIDRGAYLEFRTKLETARANMKQLEEQQRQFGNVAAQVMQQAGEKVQQFGEKIQDAGKDMMPVSAAVAAAGAATVKMAWDFEDSMAKVSTIADTKQVPLSDLEAQILELSNETGIAAGEIAENVYNAISAGQQTGDAVSFVKNATDLARAGFADSSDALDLLTTIMNAYGLEAQEVTNVSDTLIATQNAGKTTVAELAASMGKIIPTANAAGVQLDQVAAGYALMTANGVATAESTTYMNGMLNELNKSGTKVSETLKKETGKSFSDLMAEGASLGDVLGILSSAAEAQGLKFTDLFGSSEAAKAGLILLGNSVEDVEAGLVEEGRSTGQFNEMLSTIQAGAGGTASALEKLNTSSHTAEVAVNQVKNTALGFGQTASGMLAPYLQQLAGIIESATNKLNNMDESQKKTIITIAAVVAAAGPALLIVGKIVSGVGTVITIGGKLVGLCSTVSAAFKTGGAAATMLSKGAGLLSGAFSFLAANPIVLVIAGVVALGAGLVVLYNKCEWFRNAVNAVGFAIATGWNATVSAVSSAASAGLEALKATTNEKLANIRNAYVSNGGGIKGAAAAAMEGVKSYFTFGLSFIDNLTGGKLSSISSAFSTKLGNAKATVSSILDNIKGAFSDKIEGANKVVSQGIDNIKNCFNFSWKLPEIKLPHFSVSGGEAPWGFGGKGSLPKISVSWYREGGILSGAQIFGAMGKRLLGGGEAGPEAVLPLRSFYDELQKILDRTDRQGGGQPQFNQYNTYNSPKDLSPAECARQTRNETRKLLAAVNKA